MSKLPLLVIFLFFFRALSNQALVALELSSNPLSTQDDTLT